MGKTHSKPLAAWHGCSMGTACYVCESAIKLLSPHSVYSHFPLQPTVPYVQSHHLWKLSLPKFLWRQWLDGCSRIQGRTQHS